MIIKIFSRTAYPHSLLEFIPNSIIEDCVKECKSDCYYKTVRTKDQFTFMFYVILTGCSR
jgi:hypothetical protein